MAFVALLDFGHVLDLSKSSISLPLFSNAAALMKGANAYQSRQTLRRAAKLLDE